MPNRPLEANFVTLALSIASSAAINLGLTPDPQTNKTEVDAKLARFNIDLLNMLKDKTKNNLTKEENEFIERVLADLQMRFVEVSKK